MNKKKALTFTIIAGTRLCPCNCRICISKMTPTYCVGQNESKVNWQNFKRASEMAFHIYGAENVLITGKGEPTLDPAQITEFLHQLEGRPPYGKRELQTNGAYLTDPEILQFLNVWKNHGLDTVAISIYSPEYQTNKEFFDCNRELPELGKMIDSVLSADLSVRLSCVLLKGGIDSVKTYLPLAEFCKERGVQQLTLREASISGKGEGKYAQSVKELRASEEQVFEIEKYIQSSCVKVDELAHGATVYGDKGLQVCLTTGLSCNGKDEIRQLIFFPNGTLSTSWENPEGSAVLHGWRVDNA